ncbi:transporter associated domain-containing protein [Dialister invisus]|uniref:transporter associated domain-containing protein n=1 Tax=Dialister invisus TaxID=218538 RepID=UPI003077E1B5
MNKLLKNDEGILLHAHAGKDGGKIADVFTLSAGLVRIYVGKTVLERCGSGGMVSFAFLRFTAWKDGENFFMSQYESNAPAEILRVNDHVYEFDGTVILEDVSERLQMEFDDEERNNTIGGLIFSKLERIPQVGDHISFGGWKFTVLKMYGFRIMRVKAEMDRKEETEPDSHE